MHMNNNNNNGYHDNLIGMRVYKDGKNSSDPTIYGEIIASWYNEGASVLIVLDDGVGDTIEIRFPNWDWRIVSYNL